jgi:glycerol-3-phosphate dehydrogenase
MDRNKLLTQVKSYEGYWDVLVIGGGATGLACAIDAASRGYQTVLLDMHDFAKGTSSRSTKLIHGGIRYLQQGDLSLVIEALEERGLLMQNAPHLVSHQSFIVPSYEWWNGPFYGVGTKVYDMLAGKLGIKPSSNLSKKATLERIPNLEPEKLRGGVMYYDGQFDDARMAINMAQTVVDENGFPLNHVKVTGLLKNAAGFIEGVRAQNMVGGEQLTLHARVVINATGIFSDHLMALDDASHTPIIQCSQGVHIVLGKEFLAGKSAIMVPHTEDGRVLFAVPWHGKVIVGTTDTPVSQPVLEPVALSEEVDFILRHIKKYLQKDPELSDVKSVFAGLRPLVNMGDKRGTAEISRSHHLQVSASGLVTIAGGKWTTCRKMAEDTIDQAALIAGLEQRACRTRTLRIHGWLKNQDHEHHLAVYGSDKARLKKVLEENPEYNQLLHPDLPYLKGEVIWAVRMEAAITVEDVLARRTRALLLDARASMAMAPTVARLMAAELGRDAAWIEQETTEYCRLASHYLPDIYQGEINGTVCG